MPMSKRINESFLNAFALLDKRCCEIFGLPNGGVTEYINRLNNARFAPRRDEVLPRLVKYRNLRNKMVHEPLAVRKSADITKADIKWVKRFERDVFRKKDPIAVYLKKARALARRRRIQRYAIITAVAVAAVGITVLILVTCIK